MHLMSILSAVAGVFTSYLVYSFVLCLPIFVDEPPSLQFEAVVIYKNTLPAPEPVPAVG